MVLSTERTPISKGQERPLGTDSRQTKDLVCETWGPCCSPVTSRRLAGPPPALTPSPCRWQHHQDFGDNSCARSRLAGLSTALRSPLEHISCCWAWARGPLRFVCLGDEREVIPSVYTDPPVWAGADRSLPLAFVISLALSQTHRTRAVRGRPRHLLGL